MHLPCNTVTRSSMNISLFWHAHIRCIYPASHWGHHFCFHEVNVMFLCRTNPLCMPLFKIFVCFEIFVCSHTFFVESFISAFHLEMSNSGTSFKFVPIHLFPRLTGTKSMKIYFWYRHLIPSIDNLCASLTIDQYICIAPSYVNSRCNHAWLELKRLIDYWFLVDRSFIESRVFAF